MGALVSTVGLVLFVVTCIGAERRSKRRARSLCDRADRQIATLAQSAAARRRERVSPESSLPKAGA